MKLHFTLIIISIIISLVGLDAQNTAKPKQYIVLAYKNDRPQFVRGRATQLLDSSVVISSKLDKNKNLMFKSNQEIPIENIEYLKFHQKGSGRSSFLIGAFVGFGVGYLIGTTQGKDDNYTSCFVFCLSPSESGFLLGIPAGIGTGLIATIISGSANKKIGIFGNQNIYNKQKELIKKYQFQH